jgi:hypothetical protein
MAFLAQFSSDHPADLVELLQRRVDRSEHADSVTEYRAVPFNWDHDLRVRGTSEFPTILRRIRDWIAARPDVWQRRDAGAEVFNAVAGVFDDTVMAILEEGARTGHEGQMIAVGAILRQAPPYFAFDYVDFVRRLLDLASQLGEEHVRRFGVALSAAALSEVRSGVAGQPFAEDVAQRDRAREIADALPPGSREQRVYRSLQRSAEESIEWHADRDELMDGRDW